ncbi:uncharacterized protein LOC131633450 [Vicia villosa]|uniref:uncharacterized protein LOC131633450 n=1 Tax=Vicia villosa TaxID=3911 RepID=UPI00273B3382|nr:uncharacterized protein LOC131633450 [Vicia villosa]
MLDKKKAEEKWCIGDGRNIKVMNEPWIRGDREGCLRAPQNQGVYNITVNDLLIPNVKQWNMRVLCDLFDNTVVKDIMQVPLAEEVVEDRLVWKDEANGNYSVRSGYRIWRKHHDRVDSVKEGMNWNSLWRILAPARVIHLIWRICSDCLPSKVRLVNHHVQCSPVCLLCGNNYEDDWKIAGRVAVMLEGLWKNRNDFVWHNEKEEASKLGWLAFHKWQEWFTTQNPRDIQGVSGNLVNWSPPPFGWLKCNVDAAFNQRLGTTNRGWCIRNDQGNFVAAGTAWDECTFSVLEAEALALKEAIQVVNAIGSNLGCNSEFSLIIKSVKLLLLDIPNFEVKFSKRQANMVAHT